MEYDKQTKNRLKRTEGQIRGILRMMEEQQDCEKVINQLSAVSSAISHTVGVIVSENLKYCLMEQSDSDNNDELVNDAVKLLVRSRK
ncbi:metal-sensitive transcriptional regulator [Bacillus sp. 1P10SD]|uniref:metal-sensitive transcriptional regulator n=1 Tax=Bacillus sp. 1P10SD TaxID=3132265 RepID=UPI0039A6135A